METLKARRAWSEVFQALNENNVNPRILYPAKLLIEQLKSSMISRN
jgi:hypothetical protein